MAEEKVEKPHLRFDAPHEVVADPALSRGEKAEALQSLEQDAMQLSIAAGEGMGGGEPSNLDEVLDAKESLGSHPTDYAYDVVMKDLQQRLAAASSDARLRIETAMNAITAARRTAGSGSAPGSDEEIAKEAALEKLDP
jgi:hypothetical protein